MTLQIQLQKKDVVNGSNKNYNIPAIKVYYLWFQYSTL